MKEVQKAYNQYPYCHHLLVVNVLSYFLFFFIVYFERERTCAHVCAQEQGEGQRERERERAQAGSELSAQISMWGSNS